MKCRCRALPVLLPVAGGVAFATTASGFPSLDSKWLGKRDAVLYIRTGLPVPSMTVHTYVLTRVPRLGAARSAARPAPGARLWVSPAPRLLPAYALLHKAPFYPAPSEDQNKCQDSAVSVHHSKRLAESSQRLPHVHVFLRT